MTSEHLQWQKLKNNYLKQVEQALASIGHPKNSDILKDVDSHLETKFNELPPEHKNWEGYHKILIEMGPPEEYAELLAEVNIPAMKNKSGINKYLVIIVAIGLTVIGGYLTLKKIRKPQPQAKPLSQILEFSTGDDVLERQDADKIIFGESWCTTDYVISLLGNPFRIDSDGRMLRYTDNGIDFWFSKNGSLSEVHLNKSYKGQLKAGISLTSTSRDVFSEYGQPVNILQATNLHRKNDERILYQKGNISRIYYGKHGLIFWFNNDAINQIVFFKGTIFVE